MIYFSDAAEYKSSPQLRETCVLNTKRAERNNREVNKRDRGWCDDNRPDPHRIPKTTPKRDAAAKRENIKR